MTMDTTNARVDDFTTLSVSRSIDQLPLTIHTFSKNQNKRTVSFTSKRLHQIERHVKTCNALPVLKQYTLNLTKNYEDQIQTYRQFLYNLWKNNVCCSPCYQQMSRVSTKHPSMNVKISKKIQACLNQEMESGFPTQGLDSFNTNSYQSTITFSNTLQSSSRLQNVNHSDKLSQTACQEPKSSWKPRNWTTFLGSYFNFISCSPKTFASSS